MAAAPGALAYAMLSESGMLQAAQTFYPTVFEAQKLPDASLIVELLDQLKHAAGQSPLFARLVVYSPAMTLLPASASGPLPAQWWQEHFAGHNNHSSLRKALLPDPDYELWYSLPSAFADGLALATDPEIRHALQPLASAATETHVCVRADFCGHNLLLIACGDQKLLFANQFRFEHTNDVVYLILALYHQQRLANDQVPLILSGDIMENSAIVQLLRRYVRHLTFASLPFGVTVPRDYPLPLHFFYTLLAV